MQLLNQKEILKYSILKFSNHIYACIAVATNVARLQEIGKTHGLTMLPYLGLGYISR